MKRDAGAYDSSHIYNRLLVMRVMAVSSCDHLPDEVPRRQTKYRKYGLVTQG